jgi:hypothetical protein
MTQVLLQGLRMTFVSGLLLCGLSAFAQGTSITSNLPGGLLNTEASDLESSLEFVSSSRHPVLGYKASRREQAARDLAFSYLRLWSEPKQVTLEAVSSFYAPVVVFHGERRTIASLVAEKRRFAERWPNRTYRHRPETTQVACEDGGARCTVRSSFDYSAASIQNDRRSLGIGEHELVVSFTRGRPFIVSENSRVIIRGRGNMTRFLRQRF